MPEPAEPPRDAEGRSEADDRVSGRWAALPADQRSFVETRLERLVAGSAVDKIGRRPDPGSAPLSYAQEELWFLDRLGSGEAALNRSWGLRLSGVLDHRALESALNQVFTRHEVLRSTISEVDGVARQIIHPAEPRPLPLCDLTGLPEAERAAQVSRLARQEVRRLFDLAAGPVLRATLYRLTEAEHILGLTAHRIAFDAWSARLLSQELSALYAAKVAGNDTPQAELPLQYGDFAHWQRQPLQGEVVERLEAFWKEQLAGELPVLRLPIARTHADTRSPEASVQQLHLRKELPEALKAVARREDATLYMLLLAAFCTLLFRYTGQDDITIGSPVAGRSRPQTEGMIGLFLNTLVLRADLSGAPSFLELVRRIRRVTLEAFAHQELPFEKLVELLRPERGAHRSPLFQVLFNLENVPERGLTGGPISMQEIDFETGSTQLDLSLEITETETGLDCSLRYRIDLFEDDAMGRMLGHYQTLLEAIVVDPGRPITELPLLTAVERTQLLLEWNSTRADYPEGLCVHQLVETQADKTPDSVAVVDPRGQLTYAELNARANQLAYWLRGREVGPGTLVGVMAGRSRDMVVAMLGVLKAGGAYVPLDPTFPPARLVQMLQDSHVRLLLTESTLTVRLPGYDGEEFLLDRLWDEVASGASGNLEPAAGTDLAYVIYTSGSTGTPKGVLIAHRGVVNYLTFLARTYRLRGDDVALQLASPSFDMSVREIYGPLIAGGCVVLVGGGDARDPDHLLSKIEERRVTCLLGIVPTMLNALVEAAGVRGGDLRSLRLIMVGGDVFPRESLLKARAVFPWGPVIVNQYGPTEITMIATHYPAPESQMGVSGETIPIGRPIANTQIYVLDPHHQPVPVGVPGEVFIGGVGVARGYLNRPELTAERFVDDPYSAGGVHRLYKTGDRARYRSDGNLEFLGRLDDQVKIRGFRVELGEIEAVLGQHPSVSLAAVVAEHDGQHGSRLVAHVVDRSGHEFRPAILRDFLKERLPDFMVPSVFIALTSMPLTPTGKIDRRALPAPDQARPKLEEAFVAPRTPVERALGGIWCDLLGMDQVGLHDNFFDLGGHSLLATRVIARMRGAFGVEVGLHRFFDAEPTIARMAEEVESLRRTLPAEVVPADAPAWSSLIPIHPEGSRPPLFCVHWAGGHVVIYRDLARHLGPDQPVYGLQALGLDGIRRPHARIEDMAAHYLREVRALQPTGPYYLVGASMGGKIAYEMAQQLLGQGERVAMLALIDATGDVDRQPLPVDERFQLHLTNLRRLGWARGVEYLGERVRVRLRRLAYGWWIRTGRPWPRFLRNLRAIGYAAARNYHPRSYPGKVTLFRASHRPLGGTSEFFLGWDRVAEGGMEVHEIPGDHVTLLKEPGARLLAEALSRCLSRGAQGG